MSVQNERFQLSYRRRESEEAVGERDNEAIGELALETAIVESLAASRRLVVL